MRSDRRSREPGTYWPIIGSPAISGTPHERARRALRFWRRWWLAGIALLIALPLPAARATPARDPDNGHYYDAIPVNQGIPWETARTAAGKRTYRGLPGHLATVTSLAESQFISTQFSDATSNGYWLGGFQIHRILDSAAGRQWVTGEPWGFTNWNQESSNEPSDYCGRAPAPLGRCGCLDPHGLTSRVLPVRLRRLAALDMGLAQPSSNAVDSTGVSRRSK